MTQTLNDNELLVAVCGPFTARLCGKSLQIPSRKAKALLAILALEYPKPVMRDVLCRLLWPTVDTANARSSLRQNLTVLRKALSQKGQSPIAARSDSVCIEYVPFRCDLTALLDARDPKAIVQVSETLPQLLADLGFVSGEFDHWVDGKRTRYVGITQARLRETYEDIDEATETRIHCAKAALQLDDLDEHAIRALMRCHADTNNSAAALRIYNRFFEMLEGDLDAEPSVETQDLAVAIKLAQQPAKVAAPQERRLLASTEPRTSNVTIAVMPFEIFGSNEVTDFLSIGVMDQITCYLASFKAPSVISSNTTRRYLGQLPRPADVGRELNAKFVLTGFVRIQGPDAVVSTQLVESRTEQVLWATNKTCGTCELTGLSLPIAHEIACAIVPTVEAEELRQTHAITAQELAPYHLVLRAKDNIFALDKQGFLEAGALLRQAVELEPHFAPGHALFAHWYTIALWEGWSEDAQAHRAQLEWHLRQAQRLAPRDGRVIALAAHNQMMLNRDYDVALSQLSDAIDLMPNDSETLAWSVPTLTCTRHAEEAVRNGKRAIDLSPYDPFLARNEHFLSFALFTHGDFDSSAEYGMSCYKRHPEFYSGNLRVTIAALCAAGRKQETVELVERHNRIEPEFQVSEFKKKQRLKHASDRDAFASLLLEAGMPN
ncbi:MAG: BTAD domain-containing putative transcriptional regulator [Pseudomonadota bacterium]